MAWPKGKPRNPRPESNMQPANDAPAVVEAAPAPLSTGQPISLVDANRYARSVDAGMRERRDGVVAKCLAEIAAVYGDEKAAQAAPMLRDLIDGKPIAGRKPKPLRMPVNA